MDKSIEDVRMQLWCDVWVAVASSSNVRDTCICANWADIALENFDKRFIEKKDK